MIDASARIKLLNTSIEYDTAFGTKKWCELIPFLKFKEDWLVKVITPFGGAVVRFLVSKKGLKDRVSVYLDGYSMLGAPEEPYWEVHPYDGDCFRCKLEETKELVKAIDKSLKQMEKHDNNHKRGTKIRKNNNPKGNTRSSNRRSVGRQGRAVHR